jgi:hypothetical protein
MTINVIERIGSKYKYVSNITDHVGSIGAPSRSAVFIRGTSIKRWEFPKIAGRNTKANIFQMVSARFKATTDLDYYNKSNNNNNNNDRLCGLVVRVAGC